MTRKTCFKQPPFDIVLQSVCSELFSNNYSRLRHIKTGVRKRDNWDFDELPKNNSELLLFLEINGILLDDLKGETSHIGHIMARNKMPRTCTNSVCYKVKQSPVSPDYSHRLRTRRTTTFVNNYTDTSGDDDSNHMKPMRELRSSARISLAQLKIEQGSETWSSGRPKRSCLKQKRFSADERLVVDNKSYFKVEIMANKLRSSGVSNRDSEIPIRKKIKTPSSVSEDSEDDKESLVKFPFKKLRYAELTRLNNEAENFLFPRKDDSTSEEEVSADSSNLSPVSSKRTDQQSLLSSDSSVKPNKNNKQEPEEESSMDSILSETSSVTRKKRRLTQVEAFILDNQKYYKFETPGSRLRYQGSYLSPVTTKNNGERAVTKPIKQVKSKETTVTTTEVVKPAFDLDEVKFSFEITPNKEIWYQTFNRQDSGKESFSCYAYRNPGFYKPFLLPYEMGPLPPLDPKICYHNYHEAKKRLMGDSAASTSAACSTPISSTSSTKVDDANSTWDDTKTSEDSACNSNTPESFRHKPKLMKPRKGLFANSKNPRKSPRQHASTLAILSSLIHQRKRRELNASKHNLSPVLEEVKVPEEPETDYEAIAKNIDDMLSNCMDQVDDDSIESELCGGRNEVYIDLHCTPDAVRSLDEYSNFKENRGYSNVLGKKLKADGTIARKLGRKKKKNRTGWPNKNKRIPFRKDGSNSIEDLAGSEQENSITSVHSEENEDDNCNNKNSKNHSLLRYIKDTISPSKNNKKLAPSTNSDDNNKINGDVQPSNNFNKFNGVASEYEVNFRKVGTPKRKENRESSMDNCAEVVIASVSDKIDCVNVGLDEWENAERVLAAKIRSESINNDIQFQPIVRVQKLDNDVVKLSAKQERIMPRRMRPRRMPASPKSSRMLRRPRGGWYRERYNNNNN